MNNFINNNPIRYFYSEQNKACFHPLEPSNRQLPRVQFPQLQYFIQQQPLTVDQYRVRQQQKNGFQDPINWFRNPSQVIMSNFVYPIADNIVKFMGKN